MTNYPTDLSAVTDNVDDALARYINQLEEKVGVDDSAVTTSLDYRSKILMPMQSMARQALINGNFDIWQRGTNFTAGSTSANDDDTWLIDRWLLLSDGDDIVDILRSSTVPDSGSRFSMVLQVETAEKKFGICQIFENVDSIKLDNKTVSLSFKAKADAGITKMKAVVLAWDGTADTVTSDVVSAWNADGVTPTFATNWTVENTPAELTTTTSWQTFTIEGISIDTASMTNLAVFIWCDDMTTSADDDIWITQIQLNEGSVALPFQPKSYADELRACQRYCVRYDSVGSSQTMYGLGYWLSATAFRALMYLPVEMRTIPTLTTSSTAAEFRVWLGITAINCSAVPTINAASNKIVKLTITVAEGGVDSAAGGFDSTTNENSWLVFSAEL